MEARANVERAPCARWEVEYVEGRVVEITCRHYGEDPASITLASRIGAEIIGDSLDVVGYVMELEEAFAITITDEVLQEWFPGQPFPLWRMVEMVLFLRGSGRPDRSRWTQPRDPLPAAETLPFTQLGGWLSPEEWRDGPLYEVLGPNREGQRQYRRRTDGMRCVVLPESEVWVGSDEPDALPDQRPVHRVRLSPFLADAEPVSATAYARFLNSVGAIPPAVLGEWCLADARDRRGPHFPLRRNWRGRWEPLAGAGRQPVVLVSWYGANAYSLWANRLDWRRYRGDGTVPGGLQGRAADAAASVAGPPESCLPSEAQFEYAARGPEPRRYPWGDGPATPDRVRVARHVTGATYAPDGLPSAGVSERLGMSPFGLHHAAGNVWQWCLDWYAADFYRRPEAGRADARNTEPTGVRCERGGSWVGPAELARAAYRRGRPPSATGRCLGFRCVGRPEALG